uniref:Secreted RxLR effector peptide protein n=1 Tax=Steinernema glaseri TaxID=37863 RepID=A0A1I7YL16_9BILA
MRSSGIFFVAGALLAVALAIDVLPINPIKQHETQLVHVNETFPKDEYKEIRRLLATVIRNAYAVQHQRKFQYHNVFNATHSAAVTNLSALQKAIDALPKLPSSLHAIRGEIPRWRTIFEMAPYFSTDKPLRNAFWEIGRRSIDFFFEILPFSRYRSHNDTIEAFSIFLQSIIEID